MVCYGGALAETVSCAGGPRSYTLVIVERRLTGPFLAPAPLRLRFTFGGRSHMHDAAFAKLLRGLKACSVARV